MSKSFAIALALSIAPAWVRLGASSEQTPSHGTPAASAAAVDGDSVLILLSLQSWRQYKIWNYARIFNTGGQVILRSTIESSDFDQPLFAKQRPQETAQGECLFSLDGHSDNGINAAGRSPRCIPRSSFSSDSRATIPRTPGLSRCRCGEDQPGQQPGQTAGPVAPQPRKCIPRYGDLVL